MHGRTAKLDGPVRAGRCSCELAGPLGNSPKKSLALKTPLYYFALGLDLKGLLPNRRKSASVKKPEQRDLFPGALEMMILRTLERQPLHGYALAQHIKKTSHDVLQIEEGSLYPALQRLLKEDLVKAEWGISSTNRRVRTYKLTAKGAKHLEQEVSSFERMLEGITRVLAPDES